VVEVVDMAGGEKIGDRGWDREYED